MLVKRSLSIRALLAVCAAALVLTFAPAPQPARAASGAPAHDPTIIKQGSYYYLFTTGGRLGIRRSTDLLNWSSAGTVFPNGLPSWIGSTLGSTPPDLWAPDISYVNGTYYLYYAGSSFGSNNSVIGLATNVTLDPASPNYRWVDQGLVVRSRTSDNWNAIDPNLSFDTAGVPWLSWGSFWSGIKLRRIDPATGKFSSANTTMYSIAGRNGGAIEAPSIIARNGYYYLFVSYDTCCQGSNSTYRTMVGRASSITGPYLDKSGRRMDQGYAEQLLASNDPYRGPGGGMVFADGANLFYTYHFYDSSDNGAAKLQTRPVTFSNGWPVLGTPVGTSPSTSYTLVNRNSGKCLEVAGGSTADGANVQQWACNGGTHQRWRVEDAGSGYSRLVNAQSGKVLDVANCGTADGTNVQQWTNLNNACQQWTLPATDSGYVRLINRNSSKVLDVENCGTADGTNVRQWAWLNNNCQQWRLQP
ncbi:MAG TPA: family 43 glycosylhydrolase [Roseiflexaceae bacterium]|nr:family 43 glycosylhydrolase [Roseiflexaceae bacterium]